MTRICPPRAALAIVLALALATASCSGGGSDSSSGTVPSGFGDAGDCTVVDLAVSSEKIELMTALAKSFNGSDAADLPGGGCAFARPQSKASGAATTLLANGWDESTDGPRPVIWSPASSAWGAILNQRLADAGQDPLVGQGRSFMQTPLVIAMPRPMAEALGYPDTPVGWADIARLAQSPEGWAAFGHPEWGPFRLGKTNPNFSTSGLSALIAQAYAATGKTSGLTQEDLQNPATTDFARSVESAVVHYGDITMTFLNNWFRTDRSGTSLTYASAVAVEEKSLIDYNQGNPDGILDPGEKPRKPKIPLVAIYPKEGTLYSDNPLFVLDAPWVSSAEKQAAARFEDFVLRPANQRKVLQYGFRPGNPAVAVGAPVVKANGVDPSQPTTLLDVPEPQVMVGLLDQWAQTRKSARVLVVLDVSGSMGDPADPGSDATKLELAQQAAVEALDQFKPDDEVGLRIFSTDLDNGGATYQDLVPLAPIAGNAEAMRTAIRRQFPRNATPLYDVTKASYQEILDGYDPARINAVVLLTDGKNDDGNTDDDRAQFNDLLATLRAGSQGENAKPVRVFPIAYGRDADLEHLRQIAEATNSAAYDASDPKSISKVFTAVVSNF